MIFRPLFIAITLGLTGCGASGFDEHTDSPWAPGIDFRKEAADPLAAGHRLMAAGQYQLAYESFTRAAVDEGLSAEILSSLGSANLGLGRLGQAEELLRLSVEQEPNWPESLNNLGVILLERQKTAEAAQYLRRAVALDNGESDAIRENLRKALAKLDADQHNEPEEQQPYKLVQRGGGSYLLRKTP
ncbi:tetratricopeptide repeat protein [Epibacterium sp. SM1969]|uniref:Tetratricopeptide repeat protein n=1 Tax=Tritonibacter aquimaris TaxID=2663379 RepID=A0A844ALQ4_9RHOB|nr:tetratricopeptide repeat protein [Tritonibacter aquimaris]MQY43090.1 tetratricopeptide repeat protein [Tritonibacter aquimaris]